MDLFVCGVSLVSMEELVVMCLVWNSDYYTTIEEFL